MKYKIIFKGVVGSTAYGTNVEGSDVDIKGVYIQDPMEILTFGYKPQLEINKDEVYYEVRRFLELLSSANPTVLELLFLPKDCILTIEPEFKYLIKNRTIFLTKACLNSFGGYAIQQITKASSLDKKMNWEKKDMIRKTPLDYCFYYSDKVLTLKDYLESNFLKQEFCGLVKLEHIKNGYGLYYDWDLHYNNEEPIGLKGIILDYSTTIRLSSVPEKLSSLGFVYYAEDSYTQHCKKYNEYQTWLKERNVLRYVDIDNHGQKIDGKNMLHCIRLIQTAKEIALENMLNVRRPNAEYLISIRKGSVNLESLINYAKEEVKLLNDHFEQSSLEKEVNPKTVSKILKKIREWDK